MELTEESYTSVTDALSLESIEKHDTYLGERVKRGLFRSNTGKLINADLNGAINIMRKWRARVGRPMNKIRGVRLYNPIVATL